MRDVELRDIQIKVRWRGWESDTYTLKRGGWDVFAQQQHARSACGHVIHLGLKDPDGGLLIMGQMAVTLEWQRHVGASLIKQLYEFGMDMTAYKPTDRIHQYTVSAANIEMWNAMFPFDGLAYVPYDDKGPQTFADLKLFKYEKPKEIFIPSGSVDECLDRILKLQYPEQKKILEAPAARPVVQATVYSVAG